MAKLVAGYRPDEAGLVPRDRKVTAFFCAGNRLRRKNRLDWQ